MIVLDAANIIGARAEHGWWKDRAGATAKLIAEISALIGAGLRAVPTGFPALACWFPRILMVVEGAARG
nr:hypothetical protein GCM10020093_077570 [Planobispora longispora]